MFFRITSSTPDTDLAIYRTKRVAKFRLSLYRLGPTELVLNNYLQNTYKVSLIQACKLIIANAVFSSNMKEEIIMTIPDKTLNDIAKIITYGNGVINGSRILKNIFYL